MTFSIYPFRLLIFYFSNKFSFSRSSKFYWSFRSFNFYCLNSYFSILISWIYFWALMSICLFLSINFLRSSLRAFTSWVRTLSLTSYSEIALNFSVSEMNLALTSSVSFWLVSSLIWVVSWSIFYFWFSSFSSFCFLNSKNWIYNSFNWSS